MKDYYAVCWCEERRRKTTSPGIKKKKLQFYFLAANLRGPIFFITKVKCLSCTPRPRFRFGPTRRWVCRQQRAWAAGLCPSLGGFASGWCEFLLLSIKSKHGLCISWQNLKRNKVINMFTVCQLGSRSHITNYYHVRVTVRSVRPHLADCQRQGADRYADTCRIRCILNCTFDRETIWLLIFDDFCAKPAPVTLAGEGPLEQGD